MKNKMNLIIFDIDGALTQTNEIDSRYFAQAIEDTLQINNINTDRASYRYSTDSGLLLEIYESFFKRKPSLEEENLIQERFVTYLNDAWIANKSLIVQVLGAGTIFHQISMLSNWHIGIATGGWKKSALFKLNSAMIPHIKVPKAYADDHIERIEIIKTANKHAKTINGISQYHQIIYVGDRHWDEHAAMQLGIGFIGIGSGFNESSRRFCIVDYKNSTRFLKYLNEI